MAYVVTVLRAGDHRQLNPKTNVYRLAKDFNLDVSLFERMIKNGMKACVLAVQHRMRPEVARLIVPCIYEHLDNHESVLNYPPVRGMDESVFFLAHTQPEEEDREGRSHLNPYEAELALALARHLLLQGFAAQQITILTTYSGQLLHMRKIRRHHFGPIENVRITVVDNFQGEENDLIILSLVRSNAGDNIGKFLIAIIASHSRPSVAFINSCLFGSFKGFLRIENRICVALSRAKQGLYVIGNMNALQGKSKLWGHICRVLDSHGQLGSHFGLKCESHRTVKRVNGRVAVSA